MRAGDRILISLQNVPEFVIAMLGAWKLGCIVVPTNPMYRQEELERLIQDSASTTMILPLEEPVQIDVALKSPQLTTLVGVDPQRGIDIQACPPGLRNANAEYACARIWDFDEFCAWGSECGGDISTPSLKQSDVALISYTSGTTGPQKGAMNTHGNVAFASQVYQTFLGLGRDDCVLALAPLSHMTGLIAHIGISVATGCPLVLGYRFDAKTYLQLVEKYKCTFVVGPITAYQAFMNVLPDMGAPFASVSRAYAGGGPVSPSQVQRFEQMTGCYIHNAFGMTETTAPAVLTPVGRRAPVDAMTGALSIGVPVPETFVSVHDEDGAELPPGEVGELHFSGPQVVPGYWRNVQATREAFTSEGRLRSGDIGTIDEEGWVYIIDRKKDQINTSGFKVWPREVEDVIYQHPAVDEVVVVGVPDDYRGEAVQAFIKLEPGTETADSNVISEIDELCSRRLAAYKRPRVIHLVGELPKTPTGKLSRQEMRSRVI